MRPSLHLLHPIVKVNHTLNFEILLPLSTVTKVSFSDKALLSTLVLDMHEQGMSYRELGRALMEKINKVHMI